LNFTKELIR